MLTQRRFSLALGLLAAFGIATAARATSVEVLAASPDNGSSVRIVLSEKGGDIVVSLNVVHGAADLRGFFLDIADRSLLQGLTATGLDVSGFKINSRPIHHSRGDGGEDDADEHFTDKRGGGDDRGDSDQHGGWNEHGGSKEHCDGESDSEDGDHDHLRSDIAVSLGTGFRPDPLTQTTFVLHGAKDLTVQDFVHELIGVRIASGKGECALPGSGEEECELTGSTTTLVASVPPPATVPEPSTALLVACGVGALRYARRSRR